MGKFAAVLVLALCLPAIISADIESLSCSSDEFTCSVEANWRASNREAINNDDDAIVQSFDGQVEWREEFTQFQNDYAVYLSTLTTADKDIARQSCKEAIPDRVYNFRFERINDNDEYSVQYYLYRGFNPAREAWDRFCRIVVDDLNTNVFVESLGRNHPELKGAVLRQSVGLMIPYGGDDACTARFRPKKLTSQCLVKNDNRRYPSEIFCANTGNFIFGYAAETTIFDSCHEFGGARTHIRWGCQQYTWDSDTNDDNIETSQCERMYFLNDYSGLNAFKPAQLPSSGTGSIALNRQTGVTTPEGYGCEYRVRGNGISKFASIADHKCQ